MTPREDHHGHVARVLTLGVILACSVPVAHSALAAQPGGTTTFEPVEPGTSDVSPLRSDDTFQPVDLRDPVGFDTLYRVSAPGGGPWGGTPMFARRAGAITAVFPQSEYVVTSSGAVAIIPAATEFYIGEIPVPPSARGVRAPRPGEVSGRAPGGRLETRIDSRVGAPGSDRLRIPRGFFRPDRVDTRPALAQIEWFRSAGLWELASL